jgi:hypothetical protein
MLGGSGTVADVAVDGNGESDDTGRAGDGGAVVSRDGSYAFYYTQADSNLAPVTIADPASDDVYLVRENLITGVTDVASFAANGTTPEPAFDPGPTSPEIPNFLATNGDGSAVAYALTSGSGNVQGDEYVHDFTSGTSWQIGSASGEQIGGLSDDGTIVAYDGVDASGTGHAYRQVHGGTPKQIDTCTSTSPVECGAVSMSANGNLLTYQGPGAGGREAVFLYDAATGHNADLFPSNTGAGDQLYNALISPDGTHVDAVYASASNSAAEGIVVKAISGDASTTITAADIRVQFPYYQLDLMSVSTDGTDFAYWADDSAQENGWFALYSGGNSRTAPELSNAYPETADITGDGTSILYTASLEGQVVGQSPTDYPGVYQWQLPS